MEKKKDINPYHILGVFKGTSDEEIRKTYRKLQTELHWSNISKTKKDQRELELNHAMDLLKDKIKQAEVDLATFNVPLRRPKKTTPSYIKAYVQEIRESLLDELILDTINPWESE